MADLPSILGGMAQGFLDFGKSAVDLFGTGGASIADLIESARTGKVTTRNSDDFRKWLYDTDDVKDAAAKGLGTALNGVQTVSDYIPGIGAVTRNPLFNAGQGAIGGLADEFKMYGKDYDLGRAGQRAAVGAGGALASTGLADALKGSGNALLKSGTAQGLARGAVGGAIGAGGYTAIDGGSLGDVANSALQGAGMGAALGGTMGALQDFKPARNYDMALTDEEKAARIANAKNMLANEQDPERIAELNNQINSLGGGPDGARNYRTFATGDEAREYFSKSNPAYWDGLPSSVDEGIQEYTRNGYSRVNDMLRTGRDNYGYPDTDVLIGDIERGIEGYNLPDDIKVYRRSAADAYKNLGVGDTFTDEGFTSTSISPNIGGDFGKANIEINVGNGKGVGAFIGDLSSGNGDEGEFLLQRGTKYKVLGRGKDGTLQLEVVGNERRPLEQILSASDAAVNNPKLTPEQEAYFKDSVIRDENGNLMPLYHGTRSDFTVFGDGKTSSTSNSHSGVGHWFTPSEEGAKNFAESIWYGDGEPRAMETYLNVKNPKIYESVDNSDAVKALTKELQELELNPGRLSDTELYSKNMYDASMVQSMINQGNEGMAREWLSGRNGYTNESANKMVDEIVGLRKLADEKRNLQNRISELKYGDAYQRFKTDIYKMDGQTAEDANVGGLGMALRDKNSIKKYVDKLRSEGYDGIIIKGTNYDADVMGGPNDQYVVFDSNQIKNTNNLKPTDNPDIRYSKAAPDELDLGRVLSGQDLSVNSAKIAPGQLGLFDDIPTQTPKTGTRQTSLFDQPQEGLDYYGEDIESPVTTLANPYAPVDGQVTQAMRDRASEIIDNLALKRQIPDNELFNRIDPSTLPKGQQKIGEFLDQAYAKGLTHGDITDMMRETVSTEFDKRLGKTPNKDELISFIFGNADETAKKEMMDKAIGLYVAPETMSEGTLNSMARNKISSEIYGDNLSALVAGDRTLRGGYTGALDSVLSERLGIAPGNTYKKTGAYDTGGSYGRYQEYRNNPNKNNIMVRTALDNEDAVNTMAHERLHSFQTEAKKLYDQDRYSPEVKDAYDELAKDLKSAKAYRTGDEIKKRYGRDVAYWRHHDEQESRMLQQYLDAKGYTGSRHHNENQYLGLEFDDAKITPAFDKFFDKLRDLSKRGVALPALAALFGGGAYMASQENDKEKEVK